MAQREKPIGKKRSWKKFLERVPGPLGAMVGEARPSEKITEGK